MRRIPILMSLVLGLAFVLASCASPNQGTEVPGVTGTVDLTAVAGTPGPGLTQPAGTEPAITATEPAITEPVGTPIVVTTEPAATETLAATEVLPPTGMLDANRLSVLMDFNVVTQDGEQVGDVSDFVLNLTNTRIDYVIVDSGSFLSIGGRKIAVPWKSVDVKADKDGNVAQDENVFVLKFNRDVFEKAPDFDPNALPAVGSEGANWDQALIAYWAAAGTGTGGIAAQTTLAPTAEATTPTPEATVQANEQTGQPAKGRVKGVSLASDLLGMKLVDENGQPMGEIQDAVVNLKNGKIQYLIVEIDMADGSATHVMAIPALVLRWDANGKAFGFTVDRAKLDAAPAFNSGDVPDTGVNGWDDLILAYWRDFVKGLND